MEERNRVIRKSRDLEIAPTEGFQARSSDVLIVVGRVFEYELSDFSDDRSKLGSFGFE